MIERRYVFPADYTTLKAGMEEAGSKFKGYYEREHAREEYILARHAEYLPRLQVGLTLQSRGVCHSYAYRMRTIARSGRTMSYRSAQTTLKSAALSAAQSTLYIFLSSVITSSLLAISIMRKLKLLDYTDDDIACIWKIKDVNVAKPLTDRGV